MKREIKPPLTQARLKERLHYDPATGVFTRLQGGRHPGRPGTVAGYQTSHGYLTICIDYRDYYGHRLAVLYMTGKWPEHGVDHRDGNGTNNRWKNLRDATQVINLQNQIRPPKHNTSGLMGASYSKTAKRWLAQIVVKGTRRFLGYHDTREQAHEAYIAAKRQLHEGNTL